MAARSNARKEERLAALSESDLAICERLKTFRKDVLGMSREAFGEKLGVSGVVVQTMEDGRKAVRDPLLGMMCQIYGLSSEWILYGKGDMYLDDEVSILKTLGIRYGLNDNDVSLICRFIHTDEDGREAIRKMCGMP